MFLVFVKSNDLVFVECNRALEGRYKERNSRDPIVLKEIDDSISDWLPERMHDDSGDDDLVFEGDTSTWAAVGQPCGGNESCYSPRRRARTSTTKISLVLLKFPQETKQKLPLMPAALSLPELVFN